MKVIKAQQRHDLTADEKVEDKNKHYRGNIANQLHIHAAHQLQKQIGADAAQAHNDSDDGSEYGTPESKSQGHRHPFQEKIRKNLTCDFINPNHVLKYQIPFPVIGQHKLNAIVGESTNNQYCANDKNVN